MNSSAENVANILGVGDGEMIFHSEDFDSIAFCYRIEDVGGGPAHGREYVLHKTYTRSAATQKCMYKKYIGRPG